MNTSSALVVAAAIVAVGLFLSGGIYASSASATKAVFTVVIHNKFTGQPVFACHTFTLSDVRCTKITLARGQ